MAKRKTFMKGFMKPAKEIVIIEELKALIPPLKAEEREQLKLNIEKEGLREALTVWENESGENVLIDGHNRYSVCKELGIDPHTRQLSQKLSSLDEVKDWMIMNQLGRRNLTDEQRTYFLGLRYNREKKKQGTNNQYASNEKLQNEVFQEEEETLGEKPQNEVFQNTAEKIAKEENISKSAVERASKYAKGLDKIGEVDLSLKEDILQGKRKVKKTEVQKIATAKPEVLQKKVAEIGEAEEKKAVKKKVKPKKENWETTEKELRSVIGQAVKEKNPSDFEHARELLERLEKQILVEV